MKIPTVLLLLPVLLGVWYHLAGLDIKTDSWAFSWSWPSEAPAHSISQADESTDAVASKPPSLQAAVQPAPSPGTCQLAGFVDDCCNCTYQAVDTLNQQHVNGILSKMVKTAFFKYFKVNIYCDCPLWPEDGMCSIQACSVCECEESEIPALWRQQEKQLAAPAVPACKAGGGGGGTCNPSKCEEEELNSAVDRTVEPEVKARLMSKKGWRGLNNPWMAEGEEDEEYLYINLLVNPERYTGYAGEHAQRIWSAIYSQSCFEGITTPYPLNSDMCPEKRAFYRLISGMHASISAHLSADWLLDKEQGVWGPNLEEFRRRLGTPDVRYRVQNLYFAYLFVLRAVLKAAPLLQKFEYETGLAEEDLVTNQLMQQLLASQELYAACPVPFDEGRLWKGEEGPKLMSQVQASFRNITRIMDCVGCEKCKLWGKLQTLGVATALKILFSEADCSGASPPAGDKAADLKLERNEVIALINLLERFSKSLEIYRHLSGQLMQQEGLKHSLPAADAVE